MDSSLQGFTAPSVVTGYAFSLQCVFSNGGHLFAAVNGNVIHVYSTTSFENINNLKGHNGKVSVMPTT